MELLLVLIPAAFLAIIPGSIAQKKGRSFIGWWFYGWMLFVVALIHAIALPTPKAMQPATRYTSPVAPPSTLDRENAVAQALIKYKQLLDAGAISEQEFEAKKKELLGWRSRV